jgi:hypothetical protein
MRQRLNDDPTMFLHQRGELGLIRTCDAVEERMTLLDENEEFLLIGS